MRVLDPASPLSREIAQFFNGVFILSCVIFAIVLFLVVYALIRYRANTTNADAGDQSHGHRNLEIARVPRLMSSRAASTPSGFAPTARDRSRVCSTTRSASLAVELGPTAAGGVPI